VAAVLTSGDRRLAPRGPAAGLGLQTLAVVRPGVDVAVVVLSHTGALVESGAPLRPGARTELTLEALSGDRQLVPVQVLRCWVVHLDPLRFRCALHFGGALAG
jgi:hypothetical protein